MTLLLAAGLFTGYCVAIPEIQLPPTSPFQHHGGLATDQLALVPQDPKKRLTLALQLIDKLERLDAEGERKLLLLGKEAAGPLLRKLVAFSNELDVAAETKRQSYLWNYGQRGTDLLECMRDHLELPQVEAAIAQTKKPSWVGFRFEVISERITKSIVNHAGTIEEIKRQIEVPNVRSDTHVSPGRDTVIKLLRSPHPDMVALGERILASPNAPIDWKWAAFQTLGGVGDSGSAAIRRARARAPTQRTWQQLVEGSIAEDGIMVEASDQTGQKWQLFQSSALGNWLDLYVREINPDGFGEPIFLDLRTDDRFNERPPEKYQGTPVTDLVKSGWVDAFVNKPDIRQDTDGDGLTDLAEKRVGTDATKPDTDGDNKIDSKDPFPHVAPRRLSNQEKIIAAVVEARFYGSPWKLILAINVEPFEVVGFSGLAIWSDGSPENELRRQFGYGVTNVSIGSAQTGYGSTTREGIQLSCDGRRARVSVSRVSASLNGDWYDVILEKHGAEWYVVEMLMTMVS